MLIHQQNLYAASGTPIAGKRRAMDPVNKVNILPVFVYTLTLWIW
jgi:hypothetical protein